METTDGTDSPRSVVPTEDELSDRLKYLRSENPALGIPKLHNLLLSDEPTWSVSEKRTRKFLQSLGLVLNAPTSDGTAKWTHPASRLNPNLSLDHITKAVTVKYFDDIKGKGLLAARTIDRDETIWTEDPFALAAEWEMYDLQKNSVACEYCSTPIPPSAATSLPCQAASSSTSGCPARFCNRLCLFRSTSPGGHALLCPVTNPPSIPLLDLARKYEWQALHALARCTARLVTRKKATTKGTQKNRSEAEKSFNDDWAFFTSLAVMSYRDRFKYAEDVGGEADRVLWKRCFKVFLATFDKERERLNLNDDSAFEKELFSFNGFLRGLGRMSLNIESHGGIYPLHSHINHCCTPNTSIRHLDQRQALSRISVLATRDIKEGEELFITYVNPALGLKERRKRLAEWGFGKCGCDRCLEEEKNSMSTRKESETENDWIQSLEKEIKREFGVS